jgi:hypothetical protein
MISAAETGMTDDLFKFLMDQNIVYPEQSYFRRGKPTA